jgi:GTP:adenosylcobinamide-phosphate guanylyltransferase
MKGFDAVILAGSFNEGKLSKFSKEKYEALVEIAHRPMISYVVDAVLESPLINRIAIAGPIKEMAQLFGGFDKVLITPGGGTPVESLINALDILQPAGKVLVATSDIPLITLGALADFVNRCNSQKADVYYPIVPKEENEKNYPGIKRTYIKFKEGIFTGGNLFLIDPVVVKACALKAEDFVANRKSPVALAKLVGWSFLIKFVLRKLTIKEVETTISHIFGINGAVIISPFPEVGIDVDKPSDLILVQEKLLKKAQP